MSDLDKNKIEPIDLGDWNGNKTVTVSFDEIQKNIKKAVDKFNNNGGINRVTFKDIELLDDYMIRGGVLEAKNTARNTLNVLDEIVSLATEHTNSSSTYFLTGALMSYMSSKFKHDLSGYSNLDFNGMDLFSRLLQYRHTPNWSNTAQDDVMNQLRNIYPERWD